MRGRRKSCAARPQEDRRHAVSKINRAFNMKIAKENSKICNIPGKRERERMKTVNQRRGVDETRSF